MMKVELAREGEQGFENVYAKNGSWKHTTGTSIKILHFNTKFKSSLLPDLATFHGVVGECFRISKQKGFGVCQQGAKISHCTHAHKYKQGE